MDTVSRCVTLSWLTGPIFDKELRVSSRRKRNYLLRFVYVAALTLFVAIAWFQAVSIYGPASPTFAVSRMGEAGKSITGTIVWFQFIAAQLIAAVMLSTAISDEIYHRTLGMLMTTPINSFQIVIGKLFSKLLQLILLLALSLPLLSTVRVFGGVPWNYVISGICVTMTASVFAGSLSLFFSIYRKRSSEVVSLTVLVCIIFYAAVPGLAGLLASSYKFPAIGDALIIHINPFIVMFYGTEQLLNPSSAPPAVNWVVHCLIMLGFSTLWLVLASLCVRRVALRQAAGQAGIFATRKERRLARGKVLAANGAKDELTPPRPVKGPPIVWKEMRSPLIKGRRLKSVLTLIFAIVALSAAYGVCVYYRSLDEKVVQTAFVIAFFFMLLLRIATVSSTCVTSEKEARTWPILLTVPLDEKRIAFEKIVASCLVAWPFWLLLAAHIVVFTLAGYIRPLAIIPLGLVVVSSAMLVSAVGVCFSCCLRRTTTASALSIAVLFFFTVPICPLLPTFLVSPFFLAGVIMTTVGQGQVAAADVRGALDVYGFGIEGLLASMVVFLVIIGFYLLLAFAAFAIAWANVRSRIF